ncbi:MAG TPA: hypothetical protein PKY87_12940 [Terricaulis sp.]|nr:hypothetical protein [Terricaulis sp.]
MTAAEIAAALTEALEAAAARDGAEGAALISMQWELLAAPAAGAAKAEVARKTRTLIFLTAAYLGADGARIATASSVHRLG